jgi:hypothetical protein
MGHTTKTPICRFVKGGTIRYLGANLAQLHCIVFVTYMYPFRV